MLLAHQIGQGWLKSYPAHVRTSRHPAPTTTNKPPSPPPKSRPLPRCSSARPAYPYTTRCASPIRPSLTLRRSWRLEWRASHPTPRPTAAIAWNPHLPELAFALSDGSVALADVASVAAAVAGSGSVLAAAPHPPAADAKAGGSGQPPGAAGGEGGGGARLCSLDVRRVLKAVVPPPARGWGARSPWWWREPEIVGRGRICLAYGGCRVPDGVWTVVCLTIGGGRGGPGCRVGEAWVAWDGAPRGG